VPVLLISASPWTLDDPETRGLACLAKPFHLREFMMWLDDVDGRPATHGDPRQGAADMVTDGA
jgi:hypothetical protein